VPKKQRDLESSGANCTFSLGRGSTLRLADANIFNEDQPLHIYDL